MMVKPLEEQVARIIDPPSWAVIDKMREDFPADTAERRTTDKEFVARDSLAKARRIITEVQSATVTAMEEKK